LGTLRKLFAPWCPRWLRASQRWRSCDR